MDRISLPSFMRGEEKRSSNKSSFNQKLHPIQRFVAFLFDDTHLCNKVCP
jgi:hypothetical protein